jgi:hypothetical protein
MLSDWLDEVQNVFCIGTTKCQQIVMRQLYVRYVIVEYLHVQGTLGLRQIALGSSMGVKTTR